MNELYMREQLWMGRQKDMQIEAIRVNENTAAKSKSDGTSSRRNWLVRVQQWLMLI